MAILNDKNYVEKAELVIKKMKRTIDSGTLTTTKIRKILILSSYLFDAAQKEAFESLVGRINYVRVQFVYQASRDRELKKLVKEAQLIECVKEITDKASLIRFCRYMEALVAYFKYYGGKD
ncbi:type III-A CRISPR-associated protein Csm2 [Tuanshanicoccus lijuaniae]|uniref:type III-A CRISPR-associated protein Csm2 n=1 Tax=Aerococcaceae bacterium zg-1292 TaxID=2774330 RepID=UPI001937650B|nr:type III-A CRISPR-associated protein Csm2 [Aerococcaceae bacterium zg-1292]QQA36562.1 type III-A CRISPR-associated protein Csm2 [Aerococcaceae bacterium zg-1292]